MNPVLFTRCPVLVALILWTAMPDVLRAESPLRWKFKAGDSFRVHLQQQTESNVSFSGKSAKTKIDLELTLAWEVKETGPEANTIEQTVERVVVNLTAADQPAVQFDSSSTSRAGGQARRLADALQPLVGASVEIVMSSRGEITSVKPANKAAEWMFAPTRQGDPTTNAHVSRLDIERALRQPIVVFPEKEVAEGESWERRDALNSNGWSFEQVWTFLRSGSMERDGRPLLKIETTAKLNPASSGVATGNQAPNTKIAVKSHEQKGTILFSQEQGHVVEAVQSQKLVTESKYREATIVVTLDSTQKTTIAPK